MKKVFVTISNDEGTILEREAFWFDPETGDTEASVSAAMIDRLSNKFVQVED